MLLRGRELEEAHAWAAGYSEALLPEEEAYLADSLHLYQRERRMRLLTGLIAILGLAAMVLAFFAYRANLEAQSQRGSARSGELAALSQSNLDPAPPLSLLLGVEALNISTQAGDPVQPAAEQALRQALQEPNGVVLAGHHGAINALAVSQDGDWLATGGADGTLRVWDLHADDPASASFVLPGGEGALLSVGFSQDGRWLAAGSESGVVTIYDLAETNPAAAPVILRGHTGSVQAVAFSPDGRWLASGGLDLTARLWPLAGDDPTAGVRVLDHPGLVWTLAFSPDGRWLATGAGDGAARLWDLRTADMQATPIVLAGHSRQIQTLAFSPGGHWLATGSLDGTAQLWDFERLADPPLVLSGHTDWITTLAFSPDGRWLATGSGDRTARMWDLRLAAAADQEAINRTAGVLPGHTDAVTMLAFSPDGRQLATASQDGNARLWDLQAPSPAASPAILNGHEDWVTGVAYTPDGQRLITASRDATARIWDLAAPNPATSPQVLGGHTSRVKTLAFSPDGHWLATGGGDPTLRGWNLDGIDPERVFGVPLTPELFSGHAAFIETLAYSPDGRWLASGSGDGTVRVWGVNRYGATGKVLVLDQGDRVISLAFSPDSQWLSVGTENGLNWLWYLESPDPESAPIPLPDHEGAVLATAFSPDGRWLATGSADNTARLWDLRTNEADGPAGGPVDMTANLPYTLAGTRDDVNTLAFSPDGRWLATGSGDGDIRLWDLKAEDPSAAPQVLAGHSGAVNSVAFSPDGRWLASASADGSAAVAHRFPEPCGESTPAAGAIRRVDQPGICSGWIPAGDRGADGKLSLWDISSGSLGGEETTPVNLPGQDGAALALAFSPDGRWLAAGSQGVTSSENGAARIWLVPVNELEKLACRGAGRNFRRQSGPCILHPNHTTRPARTGQQANKICTANTPSIFDYLPKTAETIPVV